MKRGVLALYVIIVCIGSNEVFSVDEQIPQKQTGRISSNLFKDFSILNEIDDFRERLMNWEFVEELINEKKCFLYMAGLYFNDNKERIKIDNQKILVADQMTVADVLRCVGMDEWKGGQPQVKLIQAHRIMQSPLIRRSDRDRMEQEAFMNACVYPGDIIYIARLW